jgi:hypothetical protein
MIGNKVIILKKDALVVNTKLTFKKGQEFEIVRDVVYMGGFPLPPEFQPVMLKWINDNPLLFNDRTGLH